MKVLAPLTLIVLAVPHAEAVPRRVTTISASRSATTDVSIRGARPGERMRDVRLTGDPRAAVFVQRLPDLTLVSVIVRNGSAPLTVVGNDVMPDGRYRFTFVTSSPTTFTIATAGAASVRAGRSVTARRDDVSTPRSGAVERITGALAVRPHRLYAVIATARHEPGLVGALRVCVTRDVTCSSADPANTATWRADATGAAVVRASLVGVAFDTYSTFECAVATAGLVDNVHVTAVAAG